MIFFDRMAFLTEAKSIPWPVNRRKESPRYQRYCEIFSLRTASMARAPLSRQFPWPKPLPSGLPLHYFCVCTKAHKALQTKPEGLSAWCMVCDRGPGGLALEVWSSTLGAQLKLGVNNLRGSWGRRLPSIPTNMGYSKAVLSVRLWC